MARAQAKMEQFAAQARDTGEKVELSEAELEALIGFGELGADLAILTFAVTSGDKEMEATMRMSCMHRMIRMALAGEAERRRLKDNPQEAYYRVARAAVGLHAIADRFDEYRLDSERPEQGE